MTPLLSPLIIEFTSRMSHPAELTLPLKVLRRGVLTIAGAATLLLVHTTVVHAYVERVAPTPAEFDFWTRVEIRRAYMQEVYQHHVGGAEKHLSRALNNEVQLGKYAPWKRDHLRLFFKLAETKIEQMKVLEAVVSYDSLLQELGGKLNAELAGGTLLSVVQQRPDLQRLVDVIVLVQIKAARLQLALGDADTAAFRARSALNLCQSPESAPLQPHCITALADALAAMGDTEQALTLHAQALQLSGWRRDAATPEELPDATAAATAADSLYLDGGWPRIPPLQCQRAISLFHIGDLMYLKYRLRNTEAASTTHGFFGRAWSWFLGRPSADAKDEQLSSTLGWLEAALRESNVEAAIKASTTDDADNNNLIPADAPYRPCVECAAATFSRLGSIYEDHARTVEALSMYEQAAAKALVIDDIDLHGTAEAALERLKVADDTSETGTNL
ncbi:hypothetical protein RI367_007894 [Sorochytrium milnesiophthora]